MSTIRIDPNRDYTLKEVAEQELIPAVRGYQTVYQLVMNEIEAGKDSEGKSIIKRIPVTETTVEKIKAHSKTRPGSKISGKKHIRGSELLKFLELNGQA